jgi:hypothetical protein
MPTLPKNSNSNQKKIDDRRTSCKRGYDARWRKIRSIKLNANPMCECNTCMGKTLTATLVHHLDNNPTNNRTANLLSMNIICHNRLHKIL